MQRVIQSAAPQPKCLELLEASVAAYREERAGRPLRPANTYDRQRALAKFGCFYQQDIDRTSAEGRRKILLTMERCLQREVKRRDRRDFAYNRNRHQVMIDAFQRERMAYEAITDSRWKEAA